MRTEKTLITLLRKLADLLSEEAARSPEFAAKLQSLLSGWPERKAPPRRPGPPRLLEQLPDIHEERTARGDAEFRLWLRDQPIQVLRALIRAHDIDATRRTVKWKEEAKLADFIADNLASRLSRGSAFIGRGTRE